jgi:hypothetical protein
MLCKGEHANAQRRFNETGSVQRRAVASGCDGDRSRICHGRGGRMYALSRTAIVLEMVRKDGLRTGYQGRSGMTRHPFCNQGQASTRLSDLPFTPGVGSGAAVPGFSAPTSQHFHKIQRSQRPLSQPQTGNPIAARPTGSGGRFPDTKVLTMEFLIRKVSLFAQQRSNGVDNTPDVGLRAGATDTSSARFFRELLR